MDSNQLLLLLLGPALGITIGLAAGGKVSRIGDTSLSGWWMLWIAALLQLSLQLLPVVDLPVPALSLVFAAVLVWITLNAVHQTGAGRTVLIVIAAGLVANLLPIVANGRMPFSDDAALRSGFSEAQIQTAANSMKSYRADADTRFAWLGDVLPIPPIEQIVSIGDVLIVVGTAALMVAAMMGRMTARPSRVGPGQPVDLSRWF